MPNVDRKSFPQDSALDQQLRREIAHFIKSSWRENRVEAVMRLRALIEISELLDTDSLFTLASRVMDGEDVEAAPRLAS